MVANNRVYCGKCHYSEFEPEAKPQTLVTSTSSNVKGKKPEEEKPAEEKKVI